MAIWGSLPGAIGDFGCQAANGLIGGVEAMLNGVVTRINNRRRWTPRWVGEFVKTGKQNFRDLVTSLIADLAKLAARHFILGPIANALSGALGGAGGIFANILQAGGMVGSTGPSRRAAGW